MVVPFGVGVGDVIAVGMLAKKVVSELKNVCHLAIKYKPPLSSWNPWYCMLTPNRQEKQLQSIKLSRMSLKRLQILWNYQNRAG